ncbi:MAG: Gfo/Idh/MocA family oxidoreductase [Verrucomicrobiales bacterium]|nr:Gfo/Idh/MocA family oxidoreductase [Verrucomicrobiales bacterium]
MPSPFDRRQFIGVAAGAAAFAGTVTAPWVRAESKSGRKYKAALIGSGWWGMNILRVAIEDGSINVVALCDVDADELEVSADEVDGMTGTLPNMYRDYREMLEKEELDIVIISTPDHWHALQGIACVEAGAHVFIEKPTGHTIGESRALVEAAGKADRVVQVGMHRRIAPHHLSGMKFLKEGGAGKIGMVRAFAHGGGGFEGPTPNEPVPGNLDWDLYCGPAPIRPFNRRIHPGGFRNFLDFANGTLGDWGVHWLDQILWWTDEKQPKRVYSTGGRPVRGPAILNEKEQTSDAPDHQVATYEFENFTAVWEHRRFAGNEAEKSRVGCYFYGEKGTFHMGWRDGWTFYPAKGGTPVHEDPTFDNEKDGHNVPPLWRDFIECIEDRSRRPVADAEIGHLATNMSLLGMISYKVGRSIEWDGENETIPGDKEAAALLTRDYRGPWEYPTV